MYDKLLVGGSDGTILENARNIVKSTEQKSLRRQSELQYHILRETEVSSGWWWWGGGGGFW